LKGETTLKTKNLTGVNPLPPIKVVDGSSGTLAKVKAKPILSQEGAIRMGGLEAKVEASDAKLGQASQLQARKGAEKAYSMPPAELTNLLVDEILRAFDFAGTLKNAITAFGGARVAPDHPFFEVGKQWGEAVFLTNLFAASPEMGLKAIASGQFSTQASTAVQSVMTGMGVGTHGAVAFGQMLGAIGGAGTPDSMAAAMHMLDASAPDSRGKKLQQAAIRSGAGPGMMEAVAVGYVDARNQFEKLFPDAPKTLIEDLKTQGSRILLPFEQETSPFIEKLQNFVHFLPRRLALTEQTDAFVTFPGGFGTLNEVFEVWRAKRPVNFESTKFWQPMLDAVEKGWASRGLSSPELMSLVSVHDGVGEGLPALFKTAAQSEEAPAPSKERAETMATDLIRGMTTLTALPTAVTFFGGRDLQADDPAIKVAERISGKLAKAGAPIRVGGSGTMLAAVASAAVKADKKAEVQGILRDGPGFDPQVVDKHIAVAETVSSDAVHKVLLYENTDAFVVLPGSVGTFDELWEIACLMQTGKTPKRPIVLVDDGFWTPILDAMYAAMALGDSKTISMDDMKLFTVVKSSGPTTPADADKPYAVMDEASAIARIRMHRAEREKA